MAEKLYKFSKFINVYVSSKILFEVEKNTQIDTITHSM